MSLQRWMAACSLTEGDGPTAIRPSVIQAPMISELTEVPADDSMTVATQSELQEQSWNVAVVEPLSLDPVGGSWLSPSLSRKPHPGSTVPPGRSLAQACLGWSDPKEWEPDREFASGMRCLP